MRTPRTLRRARLLVACLAVLALPACVQMPTDGPVVESGSSGTGEDQPGIYFDPKPPQPGATPTEIAVGFLEAMKATPIKISEAQAFLTEAAQATWSPEQRLLTYAEADQPVGQLLVTVPLGSLNVFDEVGAWQRSVPSRTLELSMTVEDGEWRIDRAPNAFIVPESWFQDWYRRVSLYLFDPSGQILVPEPVFVPVGDQAATPLVRGLLADVQPERSRITRTFFPPGLTQGLSVPISDGGVADVSLQGEALALDEATTERMLTQLAWTLRQEQSIRAIQVTVADEEVRLSGGAAEIGLDVGAAYDPTGAQAVGDLFGLVDGRLVRGTVDALRPTTGPLGRESLGVRSIGVDLTGRRVAAVTRGGTELLMAPVEGDGEDVEVLSGARDLLRPAWDFAGRTWLVERAGGNARVLLVADDAARPVEVAGVSGRDVRRFLVSRDGSRLVAVVRTPRGDRLRASRILRDLRGRVLGTTRAVTIPVDPNGPVRIRDIGWRSPTSVSILSDITDDLAQVRTLSVDGAPGDLATPGTSRLRGPARMLVSSPVEGDGVFVVAGRQANDLTVPERSLPELPPGLTGLTYVG